MRISDWSSDVCSSDLPATEFIRASGQVVVALAIHAMSFGLQNIFLLDRQFIVLIHMPNCRTGAEQSKGSRCEKMLLHLRSEEHTSELQSLMRNSYAVFCLKKKKHNNFTHTIFHYLYTCTIYK